MIYTDFHGEKLSLLGFGTMRLPLVPGGGPADIDEKTTADMVRYAMDHGVNYFDTAYPYHGGMSERVIGRVLKDYDRQSFYLATKYPGHQISDSYDPAAIFEEQLQKCGVEYFDFYIGMRVEALPEDKRPAACVGCGQCARVCPQNIDIPAALADLNEVLKKIPSWADICRQREEAARRAREAK